MRPGGVGVGQAIGWRPKQSSKPRPAQKKSLRAFNVNSAPAPFELYGVVAWLYNGISSEFYQDRGQINCRGLPML